MSQLFSIAIPAYKTIFFKECISSILAQTYSNFELIILNDCSPNPVVSIVNEFQDSRIHYYENNINIGAENLVLNWNNCLDKATGDFFILMCDDDRLDANYLVEFVSLINKYPTLDIYHCRSLIIDEKSQPISLTPSWPEFETVYDNIWHRINERRLHTISDFVYRTSSLKDLGGFYFMPLAWAADDISVYRASKNKGIGHTNKPVFNYRQSRYTISSSGDDFLKMAAIIKEGEWFSIFLRDIPELPIDKIIHKDISNNIDKYIRKKKISTIALSTQKKSLFTIFEWWFKRKRFKLSAIEIVYSLLKAIELRFISKQLKR